MHVGLAHLDVMQTRHRIQGDGSIGTWTATTNLTSARDRFSAGAYNGRVYVAGGLTNSSTATNLVQYVPINSDGTLGSWVSTTSFLNPKRDMGFAVERGHIYVYGGCETGIACSNYDNDTQYAVINADGTVGNWQQTSNTGTSRSSDMMGTAVYNGHLYSVGGCSSERSGSCPGSGSRARLAVRSARVCSGSR